MALTGVDMVVAMWRLLEADERNVAYNQIADLRLAERAEDETAAARMIRSLRSVADVAGGELSPALYKQVREELVAAGEDIATFHELLKYYDRWRLAKEALALSQTRSPRGRVPASGGIGSDVAPL